MSSWFCYCGSFFCVHFKMEVPLYEGCIQDSYDPSSWVNVSIWVGHDKVCSQEWTPNVCVLRFDNWHIQEPGLCNRVKWGKRNFFTLTSYNSSNRNLNFDSATWNDSLCDFQLMSGGDKFMIRSYNLHS